MQKIYLREVLERFLRLLEALIEILVEVFKMFEFFEVKGEGTGDLWSDVVWFRAIEGQCGEGLDIF